ncbi:hypothetical protein FC72_GL000515 [Companilactobacillus tucceti DSM 20183]|uniref:Uncharacterized protein n=1 Tax=Companilactobacillus tucceti DSM 20183 TaxID=1423811 RepID=A0A0R1J663_9LACO|nr:hypothetical protein FC72_GL000515 [Companilactobacillus tucceti DSM 20183]
MISAIVQQKYYYLNLMSENLDRDEEYAFISDINNVVMGTAKLPEKKYYIYNDITHQYLGKYEPSDNMTVVYGWFAPFNKSALFLTMEEIKKIDGRLIPYAVEVKR